MRDGSKTRYKLERCALELFVAKGIVGTTIKDISQAANIAEGTLYRHYPSKEDLATSMYIKAYQDFASALKEVISTTQDLKSTLASLCDTVCYQYDQDPILFNYLLIAQHHQLPKINQEDYSLNKFLCELLRKAMQSHEIEKDDENFYAALILGVLVQAAIARVYKRIKTPMKKDAEKLKLAIYRVLKI